VVNGTLCATVLAPRGHLKSAVTISGARASGFSLSLEL
jgi:hypothetical protein